MYKAQYLVENENGRNWFDCKSATFVDEDGEYTTLFKNKNDAVDVAKAWHTLFGEKVRVIKWDRTKCNWQFVDFKF